MLIRQWVMVLPLSKSTFLSSELIPSHIPSFQLWFSRLALHSNVRSTFPYMKKCKPRNCSCNSFITHLCGWDCNQQHHGKHRLLEIPQDSQSPRIKVLCRRSLTLLMFSWSALHTVTWFRSMNTLTVSAWVGKLGTASLCMLELETGTNPELHNTVSISINDSFSLAHTNAFIPAHLSSSLIQGTWIFSPVALVPDHAAWFRLLWSSEIREFGNLAQIHIWLETLLIWTDRKKDLSSSALSSGINNYSAGRWSFPAVMPQSLKSPPDTASHDIQFLYESRWLKPPPNGAGWAIKISTWTPPTGRTLTAACMATPSHNSRPSESKQSRIQLEPTQGRNSDVVL